MTKPNILINAYACAPNRGSEPGMAWNWVVNLANYAQLHVITEGEWQTEIEAALKTLPQGQNIRFYYNPVSPKIRQMCWNQGDWRFYYHYRKWQKKTLAMAQQIINQHPIDVVHQLNMIGFREPGYLWQIKDKPFIWGPVDAKAKFPTAYLQGASLKSKLFIHLKNQITRWQLSFSPRVQKAAQRASFVVSASSDSMHSAKTYFHKSSVLLNETGCYVKSTFQSGTPKTETFNLLWVGKFDFRKQLDLALQTLTQLSGHNVKLHIVGGTPAEESRYQKRAAQLGIAQNCIWHGKITHAQVQELMQQCELFFFTSVAEGTPHVVLEAMSNQLPVLCFNTCGQGDCINEQVGIKIELSTPQQSVREFAQNITHLYHHRNQLSTMAANCHTRQNELSWDTKARQMVELYEKALSSFKPRS